MGAATMRGGWSAQQRSWRRVALLRQGHRCHLDPLPVDMSILASAGLIKPAQAAFAMQKACNIAAVRNRVRC